MRPAWLAMVFLVSAMDCGGRTALDDLTDQAPDAAKAPDASVDPCSECLALACTDSLTECALDDPCLTIYRCGATGGDDCICKAPGGAGAYLAFVECIQEVACQAGACATACVGRASECAIPLEPPVCGGTRVDAGQGGSPATCEACAGRSCASFAAACADGTACDGYLACLSSANGGAGGDVVCAGQHPGGQASAEALDVCLGGACETECGF